MDATWFAILTPIFMVLGYVIGEHIFWRRVAKEDAADAKRRRVANGFSD